MFKHFFALIRGTAYDSAEAVADRNALIILRQQIRDCADAIAAARKAVAIAIAQNEQEATQHAKLGERIADLEARAIAAIEQGKDGLAREAAETIALLEVERDASGQAQTAYASEIDRLKKVVRDAEARLRELQRGQRIASAVDKTQRLRDSAPNAGIAALRDAEDTLARLRSRQKQIDAAAAAMDEMASATDPAAVAGRLAEAGCGAPLKTSADDVLARLARSAKTPA